MPSVIYIHGFLSSPHSFKAQATKVFLNKHYPNIHYECPQLSSYPSEALSVLQETVSGCDELPFLIGSSLGGFWASHLIEKGLAQKAVLVNPAVSPHLRFNSFVGEPLQSYYDDTIYTLTDDDLHTLARCESGILNNAARYWLMVQTGDEVLDYTLATERYRHAKQTVEDGGNHSFEQFDQWLPSIVDFFNINI